MRITFIGSSHGVPEPNRKCSCALLEVKDRKYLIDAGTDPVSALIKRGIRPEKINAVFITHMHGDHTNGLIPFVDLCSWFFKDAKPVIWLPEKEAVAGIQTWLNCNHSPMRQDIEFREISEGALYQDDQIRVTALRTGHIEKSFAFQIEAEGKKVLFTGDMKYTDGPIADYVRFVQSDDFDLVVAESAHFDAMLYKEPLEKHPPKLFCLNHYSWYYAESCHHLKKVFEGRLPIVLATDDLEFEI